MPLENCDLYCKLSNIHIARDWDTDNILQTFPAIPAGIPKNLITQER